MPSILGRNYLHHLCFTKIKSPLALNQQSLQTQFTPDDHNRPLPTTTTSILIKNFNSLYDDDLTTTEPPATVATTTSSDSDSDTETTNNAAATPDFATIYASQRFFFSSPGRSNSIVDSSASSASSSSSLSETIPESDPLVSTNSIAVPTYSPDPYVDFRSSMQEMVEARDLKDVQANWDYLHELLLCYLALNPKSTHKYIVRAFADLLISLMPPAGSDGPGRKDDISGGSCSVKRKFM